MSKVEIQQVRYLTKKMQMSMGTLQKMTTFCFLFLKYRTPISLTITVGLKISVLNSVP